MVILFLLVSVNEVSIWTRKGLGDLPWIISIWWSGFSSYYLTDHSAAPSDRYDSEHRNGILSYSISRFPLFNDNPFVFGTSFATSNDIVYFCACMFFLMLSFLIISFVICIDKESVILGFSKICEGQCKSELNPCAISFSSKVCYQNLNPLAQNFEPKSKHWL